MKGLQLTDEFPGVHEPVEQATLLFKATTCAVLGSIGLGAAKTGEETIVNYCSALKDKQVDEPPETKTQKSARRVF